MSGRPYARNLGAPFAGATDLDAVLPHSFRISTPRASSAAKDRAIRSAIRRRCMEKNWKKMFSMRHKRLSKEEEVQQQQQERAAEAEAAPAPEKETEKEKEDAPAADIHAPEPEEAAQAEEEVASARLKLEELQQKLQALTDQKHAKFLLLKQILVQEARSKTSASGHHPAKKRRVDDAGVETPPASSSSASSQPPATPSMALDGAASGPSAAN